MTFELAPLRLMAEQKWGTAIAEFRRLLDQDPGDGLLRGLYAETLVQAGLGHEGRRQARRAVESAPDQPQPHMSLAWTLLHDPLGRYMRSGIELAEAEQEYRRAHQLGPNIVSAINSVAVALEHDSFGNRYGDKERLRQAADCYRNALKLAVNKDPDQLNLCVDLLMLEDFAGVKVEAQKLSQETVRQALILAAAVAAGDKQLVAEALAGLPLVAEQRRTALLTAAGYLERLRRYAAAADLLTSPASGAAGDRTLEQLAAFYRSCRHWEDVLAPEGKPIRLVQELLHDIAFYASDPKILARYADGTCLVDPAVAEIDRQLRPARNQALAIGMPPARRLDGLAGVQFTAEGDDETGYRISMVLPKAGERGWRLFVVRREAGYRVVFTGNNAAELGRIALEHLAADRPAAARQWLEWARAEQLSSLAIFNAFGASPFVKLWSGLDHHNRADLTVLAATMGVEPVGPMKAAGILQDARDKAESDVVAAQLDRALVQALAASGRLDDAATAAQRLLDRYPDALEAKLMRLNVLRRQEKFDELRRQMDAMLEKSPKDMFLLNVAADTRQAASDFAGADELLERAAGGESNAPRVLNMRAWNKLFLDPPPAGAVKAAADALAQSGPVSYEELHTLACLQAAAGESAAAIQTLRRAVDVSPSGAPSDHDWYVVGQVAEQYGLPEVAREAYLRVAEPPPLQAASTHLLAQRRLKKLPAPQP